MLDYKPKQHVCVELLQAVQQQAHSSPPVFFALVYQNDDGLSLMLLQQGVLRGPVQKCLARLVKLVRSEFFRIKGWP